MVLTASGGGISSARWTARVFRELRADPELGADFASSVLLVSSVSGGGVGAMYFVDRYGPGGPPSIADAEDAVRWSGRSSLDATAWGLAYPDFARKFIPLNGALLPAWMRTDRALAMEGRWAEFWGAGRPVPTLRSWRRGVAEGWRPLQVFNATTVETGQRMLFTPADWPVDGARARSAPLSFLSACPGLDTGVPTAARLSATFPYVTPIARPGFPPGYAGATGASSFHVADGGYYDNFGTVTAVEFLSQILPRVAEWNRENPSRKRRVLVVETRLLEPEIRPPEEGSAGWIYGAAGPLLTLFTVRGAAQAARGNTEFVLLRARWNDAVPLDRVTFSTGRGSPLSWHLTGAEATAVDQAWDRKENQAELTRLKTFWR